MLANTISLIFDITQTHTKNARTAWLRVVIVSHKSIALVIHNKEHTTNHSNILRAKIYTQMNTFASGEYAKSVCV